MIWKITSWCLCLFEDIGNNFPKTCFEVEEAGGRDGYHTLDPERDGLNPISVFCNMSSISATAVLHHNLEDWTLVNGTEEAGSYSGRVGYLINVMRGHHKVLR